MSAHSSSQLKQVITQEQGQLQPPSRPEMGSASTPDADGLLPVAPRAADMAILHTPSSTWVGALDSTGLPHGVGVLFLRKQDENEQVVGATTFTQQRQDLTGVVQKREHGCLNAKHAWKETLPARNVRCRRSTGADPALVDSDSQSTNYESDDDLDCDATPAKWQWQECNFAKQIRQNSTVKNQ